VGFFERWWVQQSNTTHARVKKLVDNGQLEFINGGDFATPDVTLALTATPAASRPRRRPLSNFSSEQSLLLLLPL
jgi:hypothetical protein